MLFKIFILFFFSITRDGVLESIVNIDREIHGDRFDLEILAVHSDNSISTCKVSKQGRSDSYNKYFVISCLRYNNNIEIFEM